MNEDTVDLGNTLKPLITPDEAAARFLALNPDGIPQEFLGDHRAHHVRQLNLNKFECLDCKVKWRMVRNSVQKRRKLLR